jgi:hypothetical protein
MGNCDDNFSSPCIITNLNKHNLTRALTSVLMSGNDEVHNAVPLIWGVTEYSDL